MASPKKPESKVVPFGGDPEVNSALAQSLGLSEAELSRASKELGRAPSFAELTVLASLWSERESQKSARVHTRRLPTSGTHVVRGLDDSAGAVDLGDGYCAVFTLESRDIGDAATAATFTLGGAIRDVLATGARPIAALDAMRFGAPDAASTSEELKATVTQLAAYNKEAAVPLVGGDLQFDARYEHAVIKALSVGVARTEALLEGRTAGFGNTILCAGSRTGGEDPSDAQVQRRLTEACLEAYRTGAIDGARAVGAAGIAGAAARLASKGETGIELDLDLFPRKIKGLTPAGVLSAASTERMLLVIKKGREDAALEVFRRHELEASIVGRVTNTGRMIIKATPDHDPFVAKAPEGKQVLLGDLPVSLLLQDAPSYERPSKAGEVDRTVPTVQLKRNEDAESELVRLLGSVNVGSREWISKRLEAGSKAAAGQPRSDAAVVRVAVGEQDAIEKLLALSVDGNGRYAALDPRQGAAMAVAEAARNVVCTGAEPLGLAHSLTFGDPEQPETVWRISETIDGIREACLALKLPVVSGEIGFGPSNSPVTPFVAIVGQLRDAADRVSIGFGRQADMVALLGHPGRGNLAGSELCASRANGEVKGPALHLDLAAEVKLQRAVLELARERLLSSAHDVSDGGLGVCLAECCIAGRIGCSVELPAVDAPDTLAALFHEEPSRVIVSFPPEQRSKVQERCDNLGVPFVLLGFVGGDTLEIEDVLDVPVQVLAESHTRALARVTGE
jgi:phosphoribosylformylglycinamidine (FGAM) synthase-like enzyme